MKSLQYVREGENVLEMKRF